MKYSNKLAIIALCFLMTSFACGGASENQDGDNQDQQPGDSCGLTTEEQEMVSLINDVRQAGQTCDGTFYPAINAVSVDCELVDAAEAHSSDMASQDFFSHTGSDGSLPSDRVTQAGYSYSLVGENIAAGLSDAQNTLTSWLNSAGHCVNIMTSDYTEIGIVMVSDSNSTYTYYWTLALATP